MGDKKRFEEALEELEKAYKEPKDSSNLSGEMKKAVMNIAVKIYGKQYNALIEEIANILAEAQYPINNRLLNNILSIIKNGKITDKKSDILGAIEQELYERWDIGEKDRLLIRNYLESQIEKAINQKNTLKQKIQEIWRNTFNIDFAMNLKAKSKDNTMLVSSAPYETISNIPIKEGLTTLLSSVKNIISAQDTESEKINKILNKIEIVLKNEFEISEKKWDEKNWELIKEHIVPKIVEAITKNDPYAIIDGFSNKSSDCLYKLWLLKIPESHRDVRTLDVILSTERLCLFKFIYDFFNNKENKSFNDELKFSSANEYVVFYKNEIDGGRLFSSIKDSISKYDSAQKIGQKRARRLMALFCIAFLSENQGFINEFFIKLGIDTQKKTECKIEKTELTPALIELIERFEKAMVEKTGGVLFGSDALERIEVDSDKINEYRENKKYDAIGAVILKELQRVVGIDDLVIQDELIKKACLEKRTVKIKKKRGRKKKSEAQTTEVEAQSTEVEAIKDTTTEKEVALEGKEIVLRVIELLEEQLMMAASNDSLTKSFIDNNRSDSIRAYVLSNAVYNPATNSYTIVTDVTSIYRKLLLIVDSLTAELSEKWEGATSDLPTSTDVLNALARLTFINMEEVSSRKELDYKEKSAGMRVFEKLQETLGNDLLEACVSKGLLRKVDGENSGDKYEFTSHLDRLVLMAIGFLNEYESLNAEKIVAKMAECFLNCFHDNGITVNHLNYKSYEFSIFNNVLLLQMNKSKQREVINVLCNYILTEIGPTKRVLQKSYILCLAQLLLQESFLPTSEVRKSIFDSVLSTNIYTCELEIYRALKKKDDFYQKYAMETYKKSLKPYDDSGLYPPPYYVYLKAVDLVENSISTKDKANKESLIDKCFRFQYDSWTESELLRENYQSRMETILEELDDKLIGLCEKLEGDDIGYVYAAEMFMMGVANLIRGGLNILLWYEDGEKEQQVLKEQLVRVIVNSDYLKRKYNSPYNKINSGERVWLQCGSLRLTSALASLNYEPTVKVKLNEDQQAVYTRSLDVERATGSYRFYYLLRRLLKVYTDYYDETKKRTESLFINETFFAYDNITEEDM